MVRLWSVFDRLAAIRFRTGMNTVRYTDLRLRHVVGGNHSTVTVHRLREGAARCREGVARCREADARQRASASAGRKSATRQRSPIPDGRMGRIGLSLMLKQRIMLSIFLRRETCRLKLKGTKKRVSDLCRTATTTYPCYIPVLGDSVGAGRTGLTPAQR